MTRVSADHWLSSRLALRLAGGATLVTLSLALAAPAAREPEVEGRARASRPGASREGSRAALAPERRLAQAFAVGLPVIQRDVVVSNTDPTLSQTDQQDDAECSIAIDPVNPQRIAISAFAGYSAVHGGRAPIYFSSDGGATWTKRFNIPEPPPGSNPIPNDQTFDFGRSGALLGSLLSVADAGSTENLNFWTGSTPDPASSTGWSWRVQNGVAQTSHHLAVQNTVDQPWLAVGPDPANPLQDNAYAAYNDMGGGRAQRDPEEGGRDERELPLALTARQRQTGWTVRVAAAYNIGSAPPDFTQDGVVARTAAEVHPGQRLAVDLRNGALYSFYERKVGTITRGDVYRIDYMVNRSANGGRTWGFGGQAEGISAGRAANNQAKKLGGVNLPGNEHSGAVDPNTGDLYYAFGDWDSKQPHRVRLQVARISVTASGQPQRRYSRYVTRAHTTMPQIAVAQNGTVGVFFYTFDGLGAGGYPQFSAHLALSKDQGLTWQDNTLLTFLSWEKNDGDPYQRVLGDYQQLKVVGNTFYGAYTANGIGFGRPYANHDPIFFRLSVD